MCPKIGPNMQWPLFPRTQKGPLLGNPVNSPVFWVAVKEITLSYHNSNTLLFTIYPKFGNLSQAPEQQRNILRDQTGPLLTKQGLFWETPSTLRFVYVPHQFEGLFFFWQGEQMKRTASYGITVSSASSLQALGRSQSPPRTYYLGYWSPQGPNMVP